MSGLLLIALTLTPAVLVAAFVAAYDYSTRPAPTPPVVELPASDTPIYTALVLEQAQEVLADDEWLAEVVGRWAK